MVDGWNPHCGWIWCISGFWYMVYIVDWMDDMVNVWIDKWIEPTSGMKTMAARLLSDKIIVLKYIVLLAVHCTQNDPDLVVCFNNYDVLLQL